MKKILILIGLLGGLSLQAAERTVPEYLTDISVTVRAASSYQRSEGSGTIFRRKVDGNETVYCWSAAHVVRHLRTERTETVDGKPYKIVEFGNPSLVRKLRNPDTGRIVGEVVVDAKILKYSDATTGHDLVLMQVLAKDFKSSSVKFSPKGGKLLRVGTHLYHAGSLLGDDGSGSSTAGILSAHGRLRYGKITLTQSTLVAFPGSSGGGCYTDAGLYCGMLVRGTPTQGFNLHVPIKRLWRFAEEAKVEWAMDPSIKVTEKQIKEMPIEDVGAHGGGKGKDDKMYPFLIRTVKLSGVSGGEK